MQAAAKPKPPAPPAAGAVAQPSNKAASSSSSSAADPNTKRNLPTAAADATPSHPSNLNPNGPPPNPSPLLPSPHPAHLQPPPQPQQPLPPSRPLLTVAAVDAAMAAIPPPPQYGLECLDRRTVALSDGTVRTYFALPLEPPPQLRQPPPPLPPIFPVPHLGPPGLGPGPGPGPGLNRWIPPLMHAPAAPPGPPKRKWDGQSNGAVPGESSGRKQVKTPELDAKTLKASFLKMVRMINENTEVKKSFRANGKKLKCAVCNRDNIDLHALLNHAYNTKNPELRADHLGLHKAICVLMGWNYSVDPVHKKHYQSLSNADAEANRGDLILWPPTIIVENTYKLRNDGQKDGMSNRDLEGKLREVGFGGVTVKPLVGKDGAMVVTFASSQSGLNEAVRLAELLKVEGHGGNPMFVKVDQNGQRTCVLSGYLATASDLEALDTESKQNVVIKSRKELDLSD